MRYLVLAVLLASACGDDAAPPPPPPADQGAGGGGGGPAQKIDPSKQLQPRRHAEDSVICPISDKQTGLVCKPEAPTCEAGLYCLGTAAVGYHCTACPERDSIRHEFKDRDFASDQARDPFESFVMPQADLAKTGDKPKDLGPCRRTDQLIASTFSVRELKLVGIARQGTKRKVLMVDPSNLGHSIERADCVGKEKALVQDIGTGYVHFQINPEQADRGPQRPVEDYSVELHQNEDLMLGSQPSLSSVPTSTTPALPAVAPAVLAPVVPPPATVVPPPAK
jgi:hypothetical protein